MQRLNLSILLLLAMLVSSAAAAAKEQIHIAVASSLRGPVEEITFQFEQRYPEYQVTVAYVASGKLVAQMVHGAPYALLISAEPRYLEVLHDRQLTHGAPETIGFGELVLWHPQLSGSVSALLEQAQFVALAQPKHAPYGQVAREFMQQQLHAGSYTGKLVYGENVAQAAHRVHVGAASVGFVALSQVLALSVPRTEYTHLSAAPLLPQTMALTQHGANQLGAQLLFDFFLADRGQQTLAAFGYRPARHQVRTYAASE